MLHYLAEAHAGESAQHLLLARILLRLRQPPRASPRSFWAMLPATTTHNWIQLQCCFQVHPYNRWFSPLMVRHQHNLAITVEAQPCSSLTAFSKISQYLLCDPLHIHDFVPSLLKEQSPTVHTTDKWHFCFPSKKHLRDRLQTLSCSPGFLFHDFSCRTPLLCNSLPGWCPPLSRHTLLHLRAPVRSVPVAECTRLRCSGNQGVFAVFTEVCVNTANPTKFLRSLAVCNPAHTGLWISSICLFSDSHRNSPPCCLETEIGTRKSIPLAVQPKILRVRNVN